MKRAKPDKCEHYWSESRDNFVCLKCGQTGLCNVKRLYYKPEDGNTGAARNTSDLPNRFPGSTYVAKYHVNERLAQVTLTGPTIPDEIMEHIDAYYREQFSKGKYPKAEDLTKEDISRLCADVPVSEDLKLKYRSFIKKKRLFESCSRYNERWYYIKEQLGGLTEPEPTPEEIRVLKEYSNLAQSQWNYVRHTPKCRNPGITCHLKYGCRKNFPNIYYVMHQICVLVGYTHLLVLFPVTNKTCTIRRLNDYWKKICLRLGWKFNVLTSFNVVQGRRCHQASAKRRHPHN